MVMTDAPRLVLQFNPSDIPTWAKEYSYQGDSRPCERIGKAARERGYLTKRELLSLARWKSPRIVPKCERNDREFVEEVTRAAFGTRNERFRIESLLLLDGVAWPMASVILHFCRENEYPILDFRALWSVGFRKKAMHGFALWLEYTKLTRKLAARPECDMRTVDKALWQYSKANQRG